jgi:hypothetical protein
VKFGKEKYGSVPESIFSDHASPEYHDLRVIQDVRCAGYDKPLQMMPVPKVQKIRRLLRRGIVGEHDPGRDMKDLERYGENQQQDKLPCRRPRRRVHREQAKK